MALKSSTSPNAVKVILDGVVDQQFQMMMNPDVATVADPQIFRQVGFDKGTRTTEEVQGTGYFNTKSEEADAVSAQAKLLNQNATTLTTYAQTLHIPKEFFDKLTKLFFTLTWSLSK